MKTEKTNTDAKSEIIQKFTAVLERHCRNLHEVWSIIKALQDTSDLMESALYGFDRDHGFNARHIKGHLDKAQEHIIKEFDKMEDTVSSALIISGQNAAGLHLINTSMRDSLNEIIDEYNV